MTRRFSRDDDWADEEEKPRQYILIIDDTLDMELIKHGLISPHDSMHSILNTDGSKVNVSVSHATDKERALRILDAWSQNGIRPEDATVICDYKLQIPGQPEEWGPDTLAEIAKNPYLKPNKLFLMSKSGFMGEDQHTLDAVGAEYFHANELFYAVAKTKGDEALQEVFSQRAKTSNFRKWCNDNLGMQLKLDEYRSPNVGEAEKGRVPVQEVIERVRSKTATHAEAFDLLDADSVRRAFRSRVDANNAKPEQTVAMQYGIEGPSTQARLAFSEADIATIKRETPSAPIALVLDHDYSPKDHAAITQANAVVMLAAGTQHIQVLAKNMSIPVLFANRGKYADLSVTGKTLLKHAGECQFQPKPFANVGDWVTIDGAAHTLYSEQHPIIRPSTQERAAAEEMAKMGNHYARLTWHYKERSTGKLADKTGVRVLCNADNAEQVALAKSNPAVSGIGLLRTEHMFLSDERQLLLMRALLSEGEAKQEALQELTREHSKGLKAVLAHQSNDFPITIRLFDFPPAEFFPSANDARAIDELSQRIGVDAEKIKGVCDRIHQENLRGAAFMEAFPEVANAQYKAIFDAAASYPNVVPNIMIPVVRSPSEFFSIQHALNSASNNIKHRLGVMVETKELAPEGYDREMAAPLVDVAKNCDFISLGTNDLTEELLSVKRGDDWQHLKRGDIQSVIDWQHQSREPINPFNELSSEVKSSIARIVSYARKAKPNIDITLCGDQASTRATAKYLQYEHLSGVSVPANEEYITQALAETGRAASQEYHEQSRQSAEERNLLKKAEQDRKEGKLPDGTANISPNVLDKSPVGFILLEDDHYVLEKYAEAFTESGLPVVLCTNISDTLKTVDALKQKGKEVHIWADANVPTYEYDDELTKHPLCEDVSSLGRLGGRRRGHSGVGLAWLIGNGKLHDMKPDQISILSFDNDSQVPEGTLSSSKDGNEEEWLRERMRDIMEQKNFAAKKQDKCVVVVDDDRGWAESAKEMIGRRFNCDVEIIQDPTQVVSRVKKGGVAAVITDQLMPEMSGEQLTAAMRKDTPGVPVAIITSSDEFLERHHANGTGDVTVMPKDTIYDMQYGHNQLRKFIGNAFGGGLSVSG